jgi:hypothetical protein
MSTRVGDSIFLATGNPGVITGRDTKSARIEVDESPSEVAHQMRHGYLNGMSVAERDVFNAVMDEVKATADADERVRLLNERLTALGDGPETRILSRYLDAQKQHIEHMAGIRPRYYSVDEYKVR